MQCRGLVLGAAAGGALCGLPPAGTQPSGQVSALGWLRPNSAGPAEFQPLATE